MFSKLFGRKKTDAGLADEIEAEHARKKASGEISSSSSVLLEEEALDEKSVLDRLSKGLRKTSGGLLSGLGSIFGQKSLEDEDYEDLEALLIQSDIGVATASALVEEIREGVDAGDFKNAQDATAFLKGRLKKMLTLDARPLNTNAKPLSVILMLGINGAGKTTTTAKLAWLMKNMGKKPMLAACDTFRAGAVAQLKTWGERLEIDVIEGREGQDPASVAFDSIKKAREAGADLLIIDTAGRLHTQKNLMQELEKINRVIQTQIPEAPHESLLVLDATIGQNAISQARQFHAAIGVSGLVMTKLDGTAKGGVVVAIQKELGLPVRFIGVGEKFGDLQPFHPTQFTEAFFA